MQVKKRQYGLCLIFYAMNSGHHQTSATDINSRLQRKLLEFMEWSPQDMKSPDNVILFEKTKNVKHSWNA